MSDIIASSVDFDIELDDSVFYLKHKASGWSHMLGMKPPWVVHEDAPEFVNTNLALNWLDESGVDKLMAVYFSQIGEGDRAREMLRHRVQQAKTVHYLYDRAGRRTIPHADPILIEGNWPNSILSELGRLKIAEVRMSKDNVPYILAPMSELHTLITAKLGLEGENIGMNLLNRLHRGRRE